MNRGDRVRLVRPLAVRPTPVGAVRPTPVGREGTVCQVYPIPKWAEVDFGGLDGIILCEFADVEVIRDTLPMGPPKEPATPEPPCPQCGRKAAPEHMKLVMMVTGYGPPADHYRAKCWFCGIEWRHQETRGA